MKTDYLILTIIPSKRLNSSIWIIDETLTGTTSPGQSGAGSNGIEGVLYILHLTMCKQRNNVEQNCVR